MEVFQITIASAARHFMATVGAHAQIVNRLHVIEALTVARASSFRGSVPQCRHWTFKR
jgi:hypothetical protein